ncbi:hypothetical protein [Enterocloster asparagiformis]|uniref:hypothetical protein n=1 Tax=Enterocloster asparagiformis TaxID=333367 RepID=UPI0021A4DFAC|nr:hypothetical protein [Enterocloster asparagiformis]UWO78286.1 hypothetical protein NQ535_08385 [[Clostridium] asparagiforme DSM 15981]
MVKDVLPILLFSIVASRALNESKKGGKAAWLLDSMAQRLTLWAALFQAKWCPNGARIDKDGYEKIRKGVSQNHQNR